MTAQTSTSRLSRFSAVKTIVLCLLAGLFSVAFAEDWDGSTSKPSSKEIDGIEYYVITSPSELAWFAYQVTNNGKTSINAILENNIYYMDDTTKLSSNKVAPIGNRTNPFDGIIDGNGKSIYGAKGTFFVDENTANAVIKNLVLKNTKYTSVVDTNKGLVENVELYGQTAYGFANLNLGTIKRCSNFAEISGSINGKRGVASGIAYKNAKDGKIISCNNVGVFVRAGISGYTAKSDSIVGGISIYNEGSIDSSKSVIDLREADSLEGVYNHRENGTLGGIVAYNSGFVGNSSGEVLLPKVKWFAECVGQYEKSYFTRGLRYIGGIAAINEAKGVIENTISNLYIKSWFGVSDQSTQSYSPEGSVFSGGISGVNSGLIQECRSTFTIGILNVSDEYNHNFFIGGLVGTNKTTSSAKIYQSYSEMHINSFWFSSTVKTSVGINYVYVGGLMGTAINTDIQDCHGLLHIGQKSQTSTETSKKFYWAGLTKSTMPTSLYGSASTPTDYGTSISNSYVVLKADTDISDDMWLSGIVYTTSAKTKMSNVYFDKDVMAKNYTKTIKAVATDASESFNVLGKTTAVMQSPAFVETLNTNAGLDDDSGIWQYCEGNYPILVSEGTCEEFYSKYGLSSSSQSSSSGAESSSSVSSSSVESSSSQVPSSSSEKSSSSSAKQESSSSEAKSSSSEKSSSSSAKSSSSEQSSSSSAEQESSSSEEHTTVVMATPQKTFNLAVNGMTIALSNTQGGNVRIFDALGHLVVSKPLSATGTTAITMQTPGSYIVRVNGMSQKVLLK